MKNSPSEDHHHLPKFYQNRWARQDGLVVAFRRVSYGEKTKIVCQLKRPKGVAFNPHTYSVQSSGKLIPIIEDFFMKDLDDRAARLIQQLERHDYSFESFEDDDGPSFLRVLQGFRIRHPECLSTLRDQLALWLNASVDGEWNHSGSELTFMLSSGRRVRCEGSIENLAWCQFMRNINTTPELAHSSAGPQVRTVRMRSDGPLLLTCDRPVVDVSHMFCGYSCWYFPLAPSVGILLFHDYLEGRNFSNNELSRASLGRALNSEIIANAVDYVIGPGPSECGAIREYIAKNFQRARKPVSIQFAFDNITLTPDPQGKRISIGF